MIPARQQQQQQNITKRENIIDLEKFDKKIERYVKDTFALSKGEKSETIEEIADIVRLCITEIELPHTSPLAPAQIPMRSCFGDFDDCPCDDECVVAEYCLKYQGKPKNSCGLTDSQCCEVQEHEKAEAAKAEREQVLDEPHIDQYLVRIRKASKALKEEPLRNIISASLLIAAEHYEAMRKNNG